MTEPATDTMKISDVRGQLDTLVGQISRHERRILVERSGVPVAALVSADDLQRLVHMDEERARRFRLVEEVRHAFAGVGEDELEREAQSAIAESRTTAETRTPPSAPSRQ